MNPASTCTPAVTLTHRSVLQALIDRLRELGDRFGLLLRSARAAPRHALDLGTIRALDGVDDAMLRDIGFAAWQIEQRALQRSRDVDRWIW